MPSTTPPKSTLFCPTCDHQSPVGGDWTVVETSQSRRYQCPECDTEVIEQPTAPGSESPIAAVPDISTLIPAWRSSLRAWKELLTRVGFLTRR